MIAIVIETIDAEGEEWGVGIGSPNPRELLQGGVG